MHETTQIKVWDPLIRIVHWLLAGSFLIAYVTEDDWLTLHSWSGYLVLVLVMIRVIWGFTGPRYAHFSDFIYKPATIVAFLKQTFRLSAKRYIGHNPAGGAMIIALLTSLLITAGSGVALLGAVDQAGPLASLFQFSGYTWADPLEEIHEFFANLTLVLVFIHLAGVITESLIHKENLVSAMFTGYKLKKMTLEENNR